MVYLHGLQPKFDFCFVCKFQKVTFPHSPAPQLSASVAVVAFCLWNNKLLWRYIELSL